MHKQQSGYVCRLINGSEHTTPNKSDEKRIKDDGRKKSE